MQMRVDGARTEVTICDVSSRGLMLRARQAPPRGTYIELLRPGGATVARVVWSADGRFGVRTREKIDILGTMLRTGITGSLAMAEPSEAQPAALRPAAAIAVRAERNRETGLGLQFLAIAAGGAAVAAIAGLLVHDLLMEVSTTVNAGLG